MGWNSQPETGMATRGTWQSQGPEKNHSCVLQKAKADSEGEPVKKPQGKTIYRDVNKNKATI